MLDLILALYLLLLLPGHKLWRSLFKPDGPALTRQQRQVRNLVNIGIPLAMLALSHWLCNRDIASLGLELPVSQSGLWGMMLALLLLTVLHVGSQMWEKRLNAQQRAEYLQQLRSSGAAPRTRQELWSELLLMLLVTAAWELLYRGFLMLVLPPAIGTAAAVMLSAVAYGAAHGYQNPRQLTLSIVTAFGFTIAYAVTHSLWWLMLLHAGLPLLGVIASYKTLNATAVPAPRSMIN